MRVAFISGSYRPEQCGVAHYTAKLRSALEAEDVESTVFTDWVSASGAADPRVKGAVSGWDWRWMRALTRALRDFDADIVHVQQAPGSYGFHRGVAFLPLLWSLFGDRRPLVTTLHEYGGWDWRVANLPEAVNRALRETGQRLGWWDGEDGFLLTFSDRVLVTHAQTEERLRAKVPGLASRIDRVPIAANVEATALSGTDRATLLLNWGWPEDAFIVAFFGFLHPVKGLETLLDAFPRVIDAHPRARLLLIGGIESLTLQGADAEGYWNALQRRVSHLDLDHAVRMTGYVDPTMASQYLSVSSVGVLPFLNGLNLKSGSLLAMMAHGLPVVGTRHDPPVKELADKNLVRLVPPRDAGSLAAALIDIVADEASRTRLRAAGPAFAAGFRWEEIARQHRAVYEALLGAR